MSTAQGVSESPRRWCVVLPGHVTRLNQLLRLHWAKATQLKRRDYVAIELACSAARVPPATGKRRVRVVVVLRPRQRAADPDAYLKVLLDGLVRCKRLVNDSHHWVEILPTEFERGARAEMRIELEEMES